MNNNKITRMHDRRPRLMVSKPGVFALFVHIAGAALTGNVLWLLLIGGSVITFLHVNHMIPAEHLLVLLVFAVLTNAILRGIRAWQYDSEEYRRSLIEYHMNMEDIRNKRQVKKDIVWDRN